MQNKPNFQKSQMNLSIYSKKAHKNETAFRRGKNKPNQTQFKPNLSTWLKTGQSKPSES